MVLCLTLSLYFGIRWHMYKSDGHSNEYIKERFKVDPEFPFAVDIILIVFCAAFSFIGCVGLGTAMIHGYPLIGLRMRKSRKCRRIARFVQFLIDFVFTILLGIYLCSVAKEKQRYDTVFFLTSFSAFCSSLDGVIWTRQYTDVLAMGTTGLANAVAYLTTQGWYWRMSVVCFSIIALQFVLKVVYPLPQ